MTPAVDAKRYKWNWKRHESRQCRGLSVMTNDLCDCARSILCSSNLVYIRTSWAYNSSSRKNVFWFLNPQQSSKQGFELFIWESSAPHQLTKISFVRFSGYASRMGRKYNYIWLGEQLSTETASLLIQSFGSPLLDCKSFQKHPVVSEELFSVRLTILLSTPRSKMYCVYILQKF